MIWGSGIYYGQYLKDYYQSVSIRIDEQGVTKSSLKRALEYESEKGEPDVPVITAWNLIEKQIIVNKESGTSSSLRLIEVYGDMRQVYPMELIIGNIPDVEDAAGCLIDEHTAYQIFGTTDAAGCMLDVSNKQYYIRGVIKSRVPMIFIQSSMEDKAYSNLELVYDKKDNGNQRANDFMFQNALSNSYTIIDGCFYAQLLGPLCQIPAWFLGFFMLCQLLRAIWKRRSLPLQVLALSLVFIIAWIGIKWFMEFRIKIPESLIPTKWSDFSFWTDKFNTLKNNLDQLTYLMPVPKDVTMMQIVKRCISYNLIALAAMIIIVIHKKVFIARSSGIELSIFAGMVELAAILILYNTGKEFHLTKGYIGMLPLFMLLQATVAQRRVSNIF